MEAAEVAGGVGVHRDWQIVQRDSGEVPAVVATGGGAHYEH